MGNDFDGIRYCAAEDGDCCGSYSEAYEREDRHEEWKPDRLAHELILLALGISEQEATQ